MQLFLGSIVSSLEPSTKGPSWGRTHAQHLAFVCWVLEHRPATFALFVSLADEFRAKNPQKRFGGNRIFFELRARVERGSPVFAAHFVLSSNIQSVLIRLYAEDRPDARGFLNLRSSWFDSISPSERELIDAAIARGRERLAKNPPQ
jgi:hypothetical protein